MDEMRPFGLRDKVGYMFGDLGNDFTFIFASSFLMVFYTKVLGVSATIVGTLFMVARFVDAFTDVTMGRIVDRIPPGKDGRFRCWIRRMAGPVAVMSFLMYQTSLQNAPMWLKITYMYVTYILWGSVFYTAINIPYGSMASVITDNPEERTSLSTFRGIGATLAGLVIGTLGPQIIYVTDTQGNQLVDGSRMMLLAAVCSALAILCYAICYFNTAERVKTGTKFKEKMKFSESFGKILTSRALLAIIGASIFLMLSQLAVQSLNNYLYTDYFRDKNALSVFALINSLTGILLISPLVGPISRKFGKKESAAVFTFVSAILYGILFFFPIENKWMYMICTLISFLGTAFFNMVIWALITDVIDALEIKNKQRDDGTVYAVYSFARKVGQALAGGIGGFALSFIGYDELAATQSTEVLAKLYGIVNIIPAIGFLAVSLILAFAYPLTKDQVAKNAEELHQRREWANDIKK